MTANGIVTIISCIISIISVTLLVTSHFNGQKKQSNEDVEKQAYFRGEMNTKMETLMNDVKELKTMFSQNVVSIRNEIDEKMKEHIKVYHNDNK